jgi:hypothetical protein
MGDTNWSHNGSEQTPYGAIKSRSTTTPFDGAAAYRQAVGK